MVVMITNEQRLQYYYSSAHCWKFQIHLNFTMSGLAARHGSSSLNSGSDLLADQGSRLFSYAHTAAAVKHQELVLTFCEVGNSRPEPFSKIKIVHLLCVKLKVPPEELLAIDPYRFKIVIWLIPECNVQRYMTTTAMVLKENLRLELMKRIDRETWVKVYWLNMSNSHEEVIEAL